MSSRITVASTALAAVAAALGGAMWFTAKTARKVETVVGRDGRMIEVMGNRLHVAEEGSGPPLLLIHGLGGQMRNFGPELIADLARDYRVIRVDRPGSGYSERPAGAAANLRTQADVIAGLIDALGLQKPTLVGHSLGGALSLATAVYHPDKVGRLLLIAPLTQVSGTVPKAFKGLLIPAPLRKMVGMTIAVPLATLTARQTMELVFRPEAVPDNFAIAGGGALGFRPSAFEGASADLHAVEDDLAEVVAGYSAIAVPTAILFGREDAILDHDAHGQATAGQIKGARLTSVAGGHMLPFTQQMETARWVRSAMEGSSHA
jgi:pimeloyl-ACP methyl ester carboxylesterase